MKKKRKRSKKERKKEREKRRRREKKKKERKERKKKRKRRRRKVKKYSKVIHEKKRRRNKCHKRRRNQCQKKVSNPSKNAQVIHAQVPIPHIIISQCHPWCPILGHQGLSVNYSFCFVPSCESLFDWSPVVASAGLSWPWPWYCPGSSGSHRSTQFDNGLYLY